MKNVCLIFMRGFCNKLREMWANRAINLKFLCIMIYIGPPKHFLDTLGNFPENFQFSQISRFATFGKIGKFPGKFPGNFPKFSENFKSHFYGRPIRDLPNYIKANDNIVKGKLFVASQDRFFQFRFTRNIFVTFVFFEETASISAHIIHRFKIKVVKSAISHTKTLNHS